MLIMRTSMLSGITRTLEIDITEQQFQEWGRGALIQNCMPHLTAGEREYLISGITDEEWDDEFDDGPEEDDYQDERAEYHERIDMGRNEADEWGDEL